MAGPLKRLRPARIHGTPTGRRVRSAIVHVRAATGKQTRALAPDIEALDVEDFVGILNGEPQAKKRKTAT